MSAYEFGNIYAKEVEAIFKYRKSYLDGIIEKYSNIDDQDPIIDINSLKVVEQGEDLEFPPFGSITTYCCKPALELIKQQNLSNVYPKEIDSKIAQKLTKDINKLLAEDSGISQKKFSKCGKKVSTNIVNQKNSPFERNCNFTSLFKGITIDDFSFRRNSSNISVKRKKLSIQKNVNTKMPLHKSKICVKKSLKSSCRSNRKSQANQSVGKGLGISKSEDSYTNCKTNSSSLNSNNTYNYEEVNSVDKQRRDKTTKNVCDTEISCTILTKSSCHNFHQPQTCQSADEGIYISISEASYTDTSCTNCKTNTNSSNNCNCKTKTNSSSLNSNDTYSYEDINYVDKQREKATKNACDNEISCNNLTKAGNRNNRKMCIQKNINTKQSCLKNSMLQVSPNVDEGSGISNSEDSYTLNANCKINSSSLNNDIQNFEKFSTVCKQRKYSENAYKNNVLGNNLTSKSSNNTCNHKKYLGSKKIKLNPNAKNFLLQFGRS